MAVHSPPTKLVYQYEETLREHSTKISQVRRFSGISPEEQALFKIGSDSTHVLETTETIFYVQGGGQPFDTGHMSAASVGQKEQRFNVESVRYGAEGRVLHFGHFVDGTTTFQQGDVVQQHLDSARRDFHNRLHTGGHLVALAVRRLMEKTPELDVTDGKAQHYPDNANVEFHGVIDPKHKEAILLGSIDLVSEALPVTVHFYKPEELKEKGVITADDMPVLAGDDGLVRVVDVVGAGAYPCGGTHVSNSSLVGSVAVKKIKNTKGVSKISYGVGDKEG